MAPPTGAGGDAEAGAAPAAEAGGGALEQFLREAELWLLDLESSPSAPEVPGALLGTALEGECAAVRRLLAPARAGDLSVLLADPWLAQLGAVLGRQSVDAALSAGGLSELGARIQQACRDCHGSAVAGGAAARGVGLLQLAVASLQLYMRANWTGPPANAGALPFPVDPAEELAEHRREVLEALEVDGEPAYELLCAPGLLWLALELLAAHPAHAAGGARAAAAAGGTLLVWRSRCAFVWQLSLAEASERGFGQSPWLFKLSVCDLVGGDGWPGGLAGPTLLCGEVLDKLHEALKGVLQGWGVRDRRRGTGTPDAKGEEGGGAVTEAPGTVTAATEAAAALSFASGVVRAAMVVELSVRLCWYGRTKSFEALTQVACAAVGFEYEVTGVLGIKRVYQTVEFAQLMCKASGGTDPGDTPKAAELAADAPQNLALLSVDDLTDVMEAPKLSQSVAEEDRAKLEKPLSSIEQLILLARCHYLWVTSNPNDEMVLQEVNALAQRVLATDQRAREGDAADGPLFTANWLSFSCGLWYRCKAEHHRNKTRERASFQLQSLVEQFADEKPSAAHRLLVVHSAGYPARFHLQRELGMRMMRMGMVSTAHEQFKKLRMWQEAVDCLMVAERNVEALDMVKELLATGPSPRLWCCLGDLEKDPKHFETAWELSKHRFARAQRSLGRHYFSKNELAKAIDSFRLALDINPLHANIWFTMGVSEMRLQRWDSAVHTFSRCIGVDDENSEAWANLAAVHSARGNLREARTCMAEATRRNRTSWKMWESFLGICMQLRDIQGVIQALRRLAELDQIPRIQERIVGMLTMAVIKDAPGLYDGRSGSEFAKQLGEFFEFLTSKCSSEAFFWRFWSELQESQGQQQEALGSRLKQFRAAQAKIWAELDPEKFTSMLADLRECLQVLAETLAEPAFAEQAAQQLRPLAYSVRDVAGQLRAKLDQGFKYPPEWKEELGRITALQAELEARSSAEGTTA